MSVLPDSRPRRRRGAIQTVDGWLIPIYCANCGKKWGMVPERFITFAFALCEACAETHGAIAHTYQEPDAVFWQRVRDAQAEEGIIDLGDLTQSLADPHSPLAKLAREFKREG